ncbi:hypothetical protein F8S12_19840 [Nostoc sp. WHI]|nr:hypothetical protein [Nostoc sp. WHI]
MFCRRKLACHSVYRRTSLVSARTLRSIYCWCDRKEGRKPETQQAKSAAIATQAQGQVEQGYSATLLVENPISGVEAKADHESEGSAVPVPNPEKWSHEAIVARSNMRPGRMQKLKLAAHSGQNPGFEFLQECWNDDPALQIVIRKLLAKFPQWGIAIV